uniref:RING-type domain-containing protein n=1 Tax=Arcella intermedia TaxID=1963864 RepID=A0A6B2LQC5_9EUKA
MYTCLICMDVFYEPVTLLCGHTYCFTCLYKLVQTSHKNQCPACFEHWKDWPRTNYVLGEIIRKEFPKRYKRGETEKQREAQQQRNELEQTIQKNKEHRVPILFQEMKLAAFLILIFLVVWNKYKNPSQY